MDESGAAADDVMSQQRKAAVDDRQTQRQNIVSFNLQQHFNSRTAMCFDNVVELNC